MAQHEARPDDEAEHVTVANFVREVVSISRNTHFLNVCKLYELHLTREFPCENSFWAHKFDTR